MKELRCIVADKRVVEVMNALDGLVLDTHWGPAQLADELNHKEEIKNGGAAEAISLLVANAKKAGAKTVTAKQFVAQMKMDGFEARSYSYRLHQMLKEKILKKTPQSGVYEVVR